MSGKSQADAGEAKGDGEQYRPADPDLSLAASLAIDMPCLMGECRPLHGLPLTSDAGFPNVHRQRKVATNNPAGLHKITGRDLLL